MDEETPAFEVVPADTDETDAYTVLINHPRIESFMDGLSRQADGSFVLTIPCGDQVYTFREGGPGAIRRLAVEFITFDPKREERRRAEKLAVEAAKQAAEQSVQARRELLSRSLLGGTS